MTNRLRILVTGANGFVGGAVFRSLCEEPNRDCIGAVRSGSADVDEIKNIVAVGDLDKLVDWSSVISGQDVVVHTAARAHIMKDECADPLSAYRAVNSIATLNLARQAAAASVKRFIFISSIKVNGEQTATGQPFSPHHVPSPDDFYGISKHEAEQGLRELAAETGMEVVIIRPPLVYGPGVKGNFASMIKLLSKGFPMPLGAVHNKRSLVALDNLVDLIITCIDHPGAADQTFLVSDGEDLSTTQLLKGVAEAMGRPSRLIPVPAGLLQFGATLLGKKAVAQRLLGSKLISVIPRRL